MSGIGMPARLYLQEFGSQLWGAFGTPAYHVGSSAFFNTTNNWRDVDIRTILEDDVYEKMGFGKPEEAHRNEKWIAYCLAFSALGKHMTGLPIDFQIQQQTAANKEFKGNRSAIGIIPLRLRP